MIKIWMENNVYQEIVAEANMRAPLETGGLLVGYFSRDNSEVVVTQMVGPGAKAIHERYMFSPDEDYHRERMGEIYDEKDGGIFYLGDWHTHPLGDGYLSSRDKAALKNIARFPDNYVNNPVMVILSGDMNNWSLSAWRICRVRLSPFCSYRNLEIVMYDES